ncbi:TetR/AcrR family transcriptional regulator [Ideonella livida]|uniref:TetR/AcrR family transcriptional regulator n=1 Tax=Ideonella livida TaxID=2707176 RepID=A0A7C9PGM7_9BURK|nr:TetR/AcrR family transcriptional regulator [Ideonella livida]NDY91268.1 TetR/AcrR family transcriptional regulator [Ideonella livida]
MKVSKAQQAETRRKLLQVAADLMTLHGYETTSMKEIARVAGVGDATIYKYFTTKEKLVMAWHEQALEDALAETLATPDLASFDLQERLQRLVDAWLERLLPDREFVQLSRELVRRSPLLSLRDGLPGQAAVQQQLRQWLDEAEQRGEIPPCPLKGWISLAGSDYLMGVLAYWLDDDSEAFAQTTRLVDMSLGLGLSVLRSDLLGRAGELLGFVLRGSLQRWLRQGPGPGLGLEDLLAAVQRVRPRRDMPSPPPQADRPQEQT